MTILGIYFKDKPENINHFVVEIYKNSEKQVAKLLFNVKVYAPEPDVMIINKQFIAFDTMNWMFVIMSALALTSLFLFKWIWPLGIVYLLFLIWNLFNSQSFNYLLFKMMIRRQGFKGKLRML